MANSSDNTTSNFSFIEAEHEVLAFWKDKNIFKKSLDKTKDSPAYVFYDGPPFATGLPHHGHLLASTIKDIVPRYFTMKGYYIDRRFGWDCHGLPIEHEIDKSFGLSAQEAVEQMGISTYNNECRKIVQRYATEWESTVTRLGRWVDFENDYRTMEPWYMESVWWVIKQLWDKGLIYQGKKVVPFSTALGTVLSNFEAGSNYKDVQDPAVTILFKMTDEDCYLAAWTTTPWTLPSNLALCVGKDIDYVRVKDNDKNVELIIAESRLAGYEKNRDLCVIERMKGEALVGKTYEPLFPYFADEATRGAFRVLADDYVTTDSGTGIVHQAPAFGEDDLRVVKGAGIEAIPCPIDMSGCFTSEVKDFAGLQVKEADKKIIQRLKSEGKLYEHDVIMHSYPFCPRSDTPIIYRTIPSWYMKVEGMRDALVENNRQINWIPNHLQEGRMGKWLEGAIDWAISRNRYWGTPLPVWINDVTGSQVCIGSVKELEQYTGTAPEDLHRDHVDHLTFTLDGEAGVYRRVEEVLDCWFESGSMPYAQIHYPFENKENFERSFPAEFIAEGLDQTRGWFYTLSVLSQALHGKPAFKNVIVNGLVMADDGKKMSKSLRNYTPPDELMEKFGADALRLYLINSGLVKAEEQNFADAGVQDMVRRALLPWLNAFNFLKTYADIDKWQPSQSTVKTDNILDKWILSKLQSLKSKIATEMEAYRLYNVVPALFEYLEQLTNWYIRLNRSRFWTQDVTQDKLAAYHTLYTCMIEYTVIMAPFAPFLSEYVFQQLKSLAKDVISNESVHLCDYPIADTGLIDEELEKGVELLEHIVLLGRQKRNQEKIKTKVPLRSLSVIHKDKGLLDEVKLLEQYIQSELNVKSVAYCENEADYIDFYAKPNSPVLGKQLGKAFKKYKQLIEALSVEQLDGLQKEGQIDIEGRTFTQDEILLFRQAKPGTQTVSNSFISIELDCELTEALLSEGLAREVVNRIQKSRKELGFNVEDRITVEYQASGKIGPAIEGFKDYIASETLAQTMMESAVHESTALSFEIEGDTLLLNISKLQ